MQQANDLMVAVNTPRATPRPAAQWFRPCDILGTKSRSTTTTGMNISGFAVDLSCWYLLPVWMDSVRDLDLLQQMASAADILIL